MGKTRLGEELLDAARAAGRIAVAARSHEGEAGSASALSRPCCAPRSTQRAKGRLRMSRRTGASEAARLVPEVAARDAAAASDSLAAQQRLYEGLANVLAALVSSRPPGVLFLDDLQLADSASLGMLGYLGRRLGGRPLLVVAAWRAEEIGADHAVLRRSAHRVIRPGRLSREDVAELAAAAGLENRAAARLRRDGGPAALRGRVPRGRRRSGGGRRCPRRRPRVARRPIGRNGRGRHPAPHGRHHHRPLVRRRCASLRRGARRGRDRGRPRGAHPTRAAGGAR